MLANPLQIRLDRLHLTLEDWARRFGPALPIRIGPRRIAVISERAVIRPILAQRPDGFRRTRMLQSVAAEMGLRGVSAAEGEDWRTQRRIVVAVLSYARIDRHFPKLNVTVRRLRRRWERAAEPGEAVNPCRDLMRARVDVTMRLAFGVDANTLQTPEPVIQCHLDKVFPVLLPAGERAVCVPAPPAPAFGPGARASAPAAPFGAASETPGRGARHHAPASLRIASREKI